MPSTNYPCFSGYAGEYPNSEVENSSLINFIKNKNICFSLAYHSKGEVVYYGFEYLSKIKLKEIKKYAKQISKNLNYKLIRSCGSTGGLTDFLAYKYNINAVTIELGKDSYSHPIKFEKINEVFSPQMSMINNLILSIKNNTKI